MSEQSDNTATSPKVATNTDSLEEQAFINEINRIWEPVKDKYSLSDDYARNVFRGVEDLFSNDNVPDELAVKCSLVVASRAINPQLFALTNSISPGRTCASITCLVSDHLSEQEDFGSRIASDTDVQQEFVAEFVRAFVNGALDENASGELHQILQYGQLDQLTLKLLVTGDANTEGNIKIMGLTPN